MTPRTRSVALALAVTVGTPAAAQASDRVWVRFIDKGPSVRGDVLAQALAARESELPPRTLARRRRARAGVAVDARDLPLSSEYLAHVRATGARVHVQSRWLNAVSVDATPAQRAMLAALPEVARLTPVAHGHREPEPLGTSPLPGERGVDVFGLAGPQLELIGATTLQQQCGLTGAGVVVGVQDTGFDLDHQAFAGLTVLAAHDFIDDDDDVGTEPGDPAQQASHGTGVLGMLAGSDPGTFTGVAPGISVILSKTEDFASETPIEEDYYVAGLEWIELQGADVFTASLGYVDWYTYADFDGQTTVTALAVDAAFDNGLIVIASMGNSGPGPMTLITPADAFGAIGIGAVDLGGVVAGFSSRGPTADGRIKPDVAAPGLGTTSVEFGSLDQYGGFNGTSAAAPMAAGLVALLLEARPTLSAQEMMDLLRATSSQSAAPDNELGYGVVDGRLASGDACGCNDSDGDGHLGVLCGGDDCEDGSAAAQPGAQEICDGLDDDCDGELPPDELDADGDGVLVCAGDCDDDEAQAAPGLPEICGDGIDNDCVDGDEPCPASTGSDEGPLGSGGGTASETTMAGGEGPASLDGTTASDGTDSAVSATDDEGGCACTTTPSRWGGWGLLGLWGWMIALGRRRTAGPMASTILCRSMCCRSRPTQASSRLRVSPTSRRWASPATTRGPIRNSAEGSAAAAARPRCAPSCWSTPSSSQPSLDHMIDHMISWAERRSTK